MGGVSRKDYDSCRDEGVVVWLTEHLLELEGWNYPDRRKTGWCFACRRAEDEGVQYISMMSWMKVITELERSSFIELLLKENGVEYAALTISHLDGEPLQTQWIPRLIQYFVVTSHRGNQWCTTDMKFPYPTSAHCMLVEMPTTSGRWRWLEDPLIC